MKKIFYLFFILLFAATVFSRLYWMEHKAGLYMDEHFSVIAANYGDYIFEKGFDTNRIYAGKEIKQLTLCDNASIKDAIKDIVFLYKDNRDPPHTNLYYSLLRISLIGLETSDFHDVVFRGTLLNLFFFSFSFLLFFLLLKLIFEDNFISLLATFGTFMSPAAISNTIFLRPYQVQEAFFIALAYIVTKMLVNFKSKTSKCGDNSLININLKALLSVSIIAAFTLLTGYYTILYIFFIGIFIVWYNAKENKIGKELLKNEITFYAIVLVFAFLLAQALYSHYLFGYIGYRVIGTAHTLSIGNFTNNLFDSITAPFVILYKHYFTPYVISVILLTLIYTLFAKNKLAFSARNIGFFLIPIAFIFSVIYLAPTKILRYILPVIPFLVILPTVLLKSIKNNAHKIVLSILLALAFTASGYDAKNIEYTFTRQAKEFKFTSDVNVPVLIINKEVPPPWWRYLSIIVYLNDKQNYIFTEDSKNIAENTDKIKNFNEFYVVICRKHDETDKTHYENIANSGFQIVAEYDAGYMQDIKDYVFKCFKLKKQPK